MSRNFKIIQTRPEFRSLEQQSIHAALQEGKQNLISTEVGRLMTEYLNVLQKTNRTPVTEEDLLQLVPNCCRPIEAIAFRFAADLAGTGERHYY